MRAASKTVRELPKSHLVLRGIFSKSQRYGTLAAEERGYEMPIFDKNHFSSLRTKEGGKILGVRILGRIADLVTSNLVNYLAAGWIILNTQQALGVWSEILVPYIAMAAGGIVGILWDLRGHHRVYEEVKPDDEREKYLNLLFTILRAVLIPFNLLLFILIHEALGVSFLIATLGLAILNWAVTHAWFDRIFRGDPPKALLRMAEVIISLKK